MYQRTQYFSNKFIRSGFGCLALGVFFIAGTTSNSLLITSLFLSISALWLFFGFRFKKKLKLKLASTEDLFFQNHNYKWIEAILRILLIIAVLLSFKNILYSNIFAIFFALIYFTCIVNVSLPAPPNASTLTKGTPFV